MSQYTVARDDNLSTLAQRYGTTVDALASANNISNPDQIYAGQTLNIPDGNNSTASSGNGIPTPSTITPFSQVLPFDKVFDPNLVNQLATSQVAPDIQRAQALSLASLNRGLAASGGFRSGLADFQRNNTVNDYARQQAEQVNNFTDTIKNAGNQWYTNLQTQYGQNPSSFVMPTVPDLNSFLQSNPALSQAYNDATNSINTTPGGVGSNNQASTPSTNTSNF